MLKILMNSGSQVSSPGGDDFMIDISAGLGEEAKITETRGGKNLSSEKSL